MIKVYAANKNDTSIKKQFLYLGDNISSIYDHLNYMCFVPYKFKEATSQEALEFILNDKVIF